MDAENLGIDEHHRVFAFRGRPREVAGDFAVAGVDLHHGGDQALFVGVDRVGVGGIGRHRIAAGQRERERAAGKRGIAHPISVGPDVSDHGSASACLR